MATLRVLPAFFVVLLLAHAAAAADAAPSEQERALMAKRWQDIEDPDELREWVELHRAEERRAAKAGKAAKSEETEKTADPALSEQDRALLAKRWQDIDDPDELRAWVELTRSRAAPAPAPMAGDERSRLEARIPVETQEALRLSAYTEDELRRFLGGRYGAYRASGLPYWLWVPRENEESAGLQRAERLTLGIAGAALLLGTFAELGAGHSFDVGAALSAGVASLFGTIGAVLFAIDLADVNRVDLPARAPPG